MRLRVIAGEAGGRLLTAPDDPDVRPTSDRVREAIFNILYSEVGIEGFAVADLFAGSGAYGIEALSRGAASAVFVDRHRPSIAAIEANLEALGFEDRATIVRADASTWSGSARSVDLAFIDPPYAFEGWEALLDRVVADWVVAESNRELEPGERWDAIRSRRYGSTVVTLLRRVGDAPTSP